MLANRHISLGTLCALGLLLLVQSQGLRAQSNFQTQWQYESKCEEDQAEDCLLMHMATVTHINLTITSLNKPELEEHNATIRVISDGNILSVSKEIPLNEIQDNGTWNGSFDIEAIFIGKSYLYVEISKKDAKEKSDKLPVIIVRPERLIDTIFIISVATLVSILYINFGAALDLGKVKGVLRRPVGPAIAFFCHFIFLPLVSETLD